MTQRGSGTTAGSRRATPRGGSTRDRHAELPGSIGRRSARGRRPVGHRTRARPERGARGRRGSSAVRRGRWRPRRRDRQAVSPPAATKATRSTARHARGAASTSTGIAPDVGLVARRAGAITTSAPAPSSSIANPSVRTSRSCSVARAAARSGWRSVGVAATTSSWMVAVSRSSQPGAGPSPASGTKQRTSPVAVDAAVASAASRDRPTPAITSGDTLPRSSFVTQGARVITETVGPRGDGSEAIDLPSQRRPASGPAAGGP